MNYNISSDFEMEKMLGDVCLAGGDMEGALNQVDICITLAAENKRIPQKQFHEIAYKSYIELAKKFYSEKDKDGAKYSLIYAINHHVALTDTGVPRLGIKEELLDYIKNKRNDFPLD